jgi:hypothetical protein
MVDLAVGFAGVLASHRDDLDEFFWGEGVRRTRARIIGQNRLHQHLEDSPLGAFGLGCGQPRFCREPAPAPLARRVRGGIESPRDFQVVSSASRVQNDLGA